jgi:aspartate ammonia-lyase
MATGRSVYDLVLEKGLLSKESLEEILRPESLAGPQPILPKRE